MKTVTTRSWIRRQCPLGHRFTILWALLAISSAPAAPVETTTDTNSATAAIIQAIEHTTNHNFFGFFLEGKGGIVTNQFRSIEIEATPTMTGGYRVNFKLPTSSVIIADGRLQTRDLLEVVLRGDAVSTRKFSVPKMAASEPDEARFRHVVAMVLERHWRGLRFPRTSAEIAVGIMKQPAGELLVMVQEVPFLPGGHTGYLISTKNEIKRIIPGE